MKLGNFPRCMTPLNWESRELGRGILAWSCYFPVKSQRERGKERRERERKGGREREKSILTITFVADILGLCMYNSYLYLGSVLNLKF